MGGQTFKNLSLYCEYHRHVQCADVTFDDICNIMSSDTISNIMQYKVLGHIYKHYGVLRFRTNGSVSFSEDSSITRSRKILSWAKESMRISFCGLERPGPFRC